MLYIGPISSIFDYATFAVMFFVFKANSPAHSNAARRSNACPVIGNVGNERRPKPNANKPNGTLIRYSQCQVATDRIADAAVGPRVNAKPTTNEL